MPTYMTQLALEVAKNPAPWGHFPGDYRYDYPWQYFVEKIQNRKLYTFSRNAVGAAADIRIGSTRRLEAMIWTLAQTDRSVFIEARTKDLNDHLIPLHFAVEPDQGDQNSTYDNSFTDRVGFFVDVEDGKIKIEGYALDEESFTDENFANDPDYLVWPRASLKRLRSAARFSPDGNAITVTPALTARSMRAFLNGIGMNGLPDNLPLREGWLISSDPGERKKRLEDAWWVQKFHDMISDEDVEDKELFEYRCPQLSPITTASIALSMLATIDAAGDGIAVSDLESTSRPRPKKDRRKRPAVARDGVVSLVTLNLTDKDLERAYATPRQDLGPSGRDEQRQKGSPRSRHPVRGHLFLARNGKITWRKPHWRGSVIKTSLTRVVRR